MECILNKKCNWCKNRKLNHELWKIDIWCKYYGMYICFTCYEKKIKR